MSSHVLLNKIELKKLSKGVIVEIGSARETNSSESSTFFFNKIGKENGIDFFSIDFSKDSYLMAKSIINERAILSDGNIFLKNFRNYTDKNISVLYLDNFDVIYNEKHKASLLTRIGNVYEKNNEQLNNIRSAEVHLEQLITAIEFLNQDSYIIIDDTQLIDTNWWGKGAKVVPYLLENGYKIISMEEGGVSLQKEI
jgi:hypothetical protein